MVAARPSAQPELESFVSFIMLYIIKTMSSLIRYTFFAEYVETAI
jgi:hypothetical protein